VPPTGRFFRYGDNPLEDLAPPFDRTLPTLRHDPVLIALHWLTAGLVGALWIIGQTIDFAPRGTLRVDYRSLHMLLGVVLGGVLIVRLAWRGTRGGLLPPLDHGVLRVIASTTHTLLYLLLIGTVGLGVANAWVRGDSVFNLFSLPSFSPGNKLLRGTIGDYHALAANTVLILAGFHAAAALFHHFIMGDVTLRRMLPWRVG
jgi:cytochrome b561